MDPLLIGADTTLASASRVSVPAATTVYLAAAAALVPTGVAKLRDPGPTARAMDGAGLPANAWAARALGIAEIGSGLAALAVGGRGPAVAVAALYAGFASFLAAALRTPGRVESCGCLGAVDLEPNAFHLGLVVLAAVAAALSVVRPVPGLWWLFGARPLVGTGVVVGASALVSAGFLVATALPAAMRAYRRDRSGGGGRGRARTPRFALRSSP